MPGPLWAVCTICSQVGFPGISRPMIPGIQFFILQQYRSGTGMALSLPLWRRSSTKLWMTAAMSCRSHRPPNCSWLSKLHCPRSRAATVNGLYNREIGSLPFRRSLTNDNVLYQLMVDHDLFSMNESDTTRVK